MAKLVVELPRESGSPQDREWCRVVVGGETKIEAEITYRHRLALDGTPLTYVGFVGQKLGDIPEAWHDWLVDEPPA